MLGNKCMESFHHIVRSWFENSFSRPSMPQELGWPEVNAGKNVLICAPTGSGKTLAAFLKCLDNIYHTKSTTGEKNLGVRVVYISPLKALNNDIYKNLEIPIKGIEETAKKASVQLPQVKIAIRTGDTTQKERREIIKYPPDILITTPESLFIMLTSKGTQGLFSTLKFIIVDEIHALVSNKRGVHLSISLERLEKLANSKVTRIGLSATLNPLDEVAKYLGGFSVRSTEQDISIEPREVTIVECEVHKKLELLVDIPVKKLTDLENNSIWPYVYTQLLTLIRSHKSTLIFVNNRRQAEMVASGINNLDDELLIKTHHGSMDKEVRRELESKFKDGLIRCLVATSTLELGIDIGHIDLVVQVGAPQNVSQMLQRIGRAGHQIDALSKGYIIPKTRADLLRAAFVGYEVKKYRVEHVNIPKNCLDILSQHITSLACKGIWDVEEAYFLIKGSYSYHDFSLEKFTDVLTMLADPSPEDNPGSHKPRIMFDRVMMKFWGTDLGRMLSLLGAGTITDKGNYPVYEKETNRRVGELQEEFVFETRVGERFLLGSSVWRLDKVENDRVYVSATNESGGKIPFWIGDHILWNYETGCHFAEFLKQMEEKLDEEEYYKWIYDNCGVGRTAADNLREYLKGQIKSTIYLPTVNRVVCEYFSDETGQYRLIIHSPFGGKVNAVLAIILHQRLINQLQCDIEYLYNDEGMLFHIFGYTGKLSNVFNLLNSGELETDLFTLLPSTPVFNISLRYNLTRALLVNVRNGGKRNPLWIQRLRSAEMVEAISKTPDHPMIQETFRECFYDYLDVANAMLLLEQIKVGIIEVADVYTTGPSPFTSEIIFNFWQIYQYVAEIPTAEKRNQLLVTDKSILELAIGKRGIFELLDPRAIQYVEKELLSQKYERSIKNVNDLYYFIFSFGELQAEPYYPKALSNIEEEVCVGYLKELEEQSRVMRISIAEKDRKYWIAVEDYPMYCKAFDLNSFEESVYIGLPSDERQVAICDWVSSYILEIDPEPVSATIHILRRWMRFTGPFTINNVKNQYPISINLLKKALKKLTVLGELVQLKDGKRAEENIYCHIKIYERIRRKTVELARLDIKPKKMETYLSYIFKFQRINENLEQGDELLKKVIKQLQGLYLPMECWEQVVFPSRIKQYKPQMLDSLCSMGVIRWIGRMNNKTKEIAFFLGEDFVKVTSFGVPEVFLTDREKRLYELLESKPAGFTYDYTQELKIEPIDFLHAVEGLIWKGLVTNDLFSPIRYYQEITVKNLWLKYRTSPQTGRWSIIRWTNSGNYNEKIQYYILLVLERYGFISKEIIQLEKYTFGWSDVYQFLKNSEFFSGIKRGLFIEKISAIQFAKDNVIEGLRLHETYLDSASEFVALSSCDPANILTIFKEKGSPKVTKSQGTVLVYNNGRLALIVKQYGKLIIPVIEDKEILIRAIKCFVEAFKDMRIWNEYSSLTTLYWVDDQQPIEKSIIFSDIKKMGYESWYKGSILYK